MKKLLLLLTIPFLMVIAECQLPDKGYNFQVRVTGLSDSKLYLAYHLGNRQYIKDSLTIDDKGIGVFFGDVTLDQGVYIMVLPGNRYFEFLITEDQVFSISCKIDDLLNSVSFQGSTDNTSFSEFQKEWASLHKKSELLRSRIAAAGNNADSIRVLTDATRLHENEMKAYMKKTIDENNGNYVAALIKAMMPVEVPDFKIDEGLPNRDSLQWIMSYNYNKDHFFDNFDPGDERLLRSPMYHNKIEYYFTNVVLQYPDSLNKAVDKILQMAGRNPKTFQYTSVYLFNHFRESTIMGHDAVIVKIADEVYLSGKADWASEEFITNLKRDVDKIRPSLIGNKAINLTMETYKHGIQALEFIDAEYVVLYFWEPDCGHCKEATPILRDFYNKQKQNGVEVFTVCTQPDRAAWEKYINDNQLTWINGWDPERSTHYDFFYNIVSTPTVFILDKNKTIIAKRLPVESIEAFIEAHRKFGR
ncbi:MAG: redoxin domain-containing protein [Bacteroidales bacterium]|nr:redoxin domain-containing protein [Bacteroidales bacterium]